MRNNAKKAYSVPEPPKPDYNDRYEYDGQREQTKLNTIKEGMMKKEKQKDGQTLKSKREDGGVGDGGTETAIGGEEFLE